MTMLDTNTTTSTTTTPPVLPTEEELIVHGLEKVQPAYAQFPGTMYAGLLPSDNAERQGQMMFWLFEPDTQQVPDTLVLWLNGGPGCSSFNCGVLMEHSPVTQPLHAAGYCCLKPDPAMSYNEHTWTKATTMLYVEQPIGTGFSHGSPLPETEADVVRDIYAFMQNFFTVFPRFREHAFYVLGESYAGMFVPTIARYFYVQNQGLLEQVGTQAAAEKWINIQGAGIGNGWMNGEVQGPAVIDYAWWHGLIDQPTRDALHIEFRNCEARRNQPNDVEPPPFHPFTVQDDCGIMWGALVASGFPNAYDITTWDPNVDQVTFTSEAFYNRPDVKQALHAPADITWHGCRPGEGRRLLQSIRQDRRRRLANGSRRAGRELLYMENDRPWSVVPYLAELLNAGIPVVVYNGDRDMTTNMVGTELLLNEMDWVGKDGWMDAKRGLWMVDNAQGGWAKEYMNLTYVVVYNSGHMVPYNQPEAAYDLLLRLLTQKEFVDLPQPTIRIKPLPGIKAEVPGVELWMKSSNVAESTLATLSSESETSLLAAGATLLGSSTSSSSSSSSHHHYGHEMFLVMGASFLVGILLALWWNRHAAAGGSRRRAGYQRVLEMDT